MTGNISTTTEFEHRKYCQGWGELLEFLAQHEPPTLSYLQNGGSKPQVMIQFMDLINGVPSWSCLISAEVFESRPLKDDADYEASMEALNLRSALAAAEA